ncbi:MAG: 7-cyano-7-deazaguanine synthase QueC [Gemmatimonadota bacterium]|nr:7-cyano-7-deazaguanine synthase QueC [Gemmatimonadota bacterium]
MAALPRKSVLLLSGGMDSTTLLWWMRDRGISEIHTVSIDYGQRHAVELESGSSLSRLAGADSHRRLEVDLRQIGGNPLTDVGRPVPAAEQNRQALTVVPFRNMLFVTLAAAWAERRGCKDLFLSPVRDDFQIYRDCRREFYDILEKALCLGATRRTDYRIHTPFVEKWKVEIVRMGLDLGVPYAETHTCYEGKRPACGRCDACVERIDAFRANRAVDPLAYEIEIDWTVSP